MWPGRFRHKVDVRLPLYNNGPAMSRSKLKVEIGG